jgi:pimeloyl-ACP methyl ester carboxylesterase
VYPVNTRLAEHPVPVREGFARADDGVRLYYRAEGSGPALLCSNGIGVSTFFWAPLSRELSDRYTVVRWDYRGHGLSDDPADPRSATVSECARGALCVLDALGIKRAALLGHSMGSQVGFEVYRMKPDRVAALVPTLGTYRRAVETFFGTAVSLKLFEIMRHAIPVAPRLVQRATAKVMRSSLPDATARLFRLVHPDLCPKDALVPYFAHNARVDPLLFLSLAESMQAHDATDLLPKIAVPTLVVAGDRDLFTPLSCAREMAEQIPGAELFVIPGGSHAALVEQPLLLSLRVAKFLAERVRF